MPANAQRWRLQAAAIVILSAMQFAACSSPPASSDPSSGMATMPVTLPDGAVIRAELALQPEQHQRGLMYRQELATDAGMLFVFFDMRVRTFWMFQTRIPLDIIWLDDARRIVEISANTPPCPESSAVDCPNYGGSVLSRYVLELAAGQAAAHGLKVGDQLSF